MTTCREVSSLITDYLDGKLGPLQWLRFQLHLLVCPSCRQHLANMRQLVDALGRIPPETEVPLRVVERLRGLAQL